MRRAVLVAVLFIPLASKCGRIPGLSVETGSPLAICEQFWTDKELPQNPKVCVPCKDGTIARHGEVCGEGKR